MPKRILHLKIVDYSILRVTFTKDDVLYDGANLLPRIQLNNECLVLKFNLESFLEKIGSLIGFCKLLTKLFGKLLVIKLYILHFLHQNFTHLEVLLALALQLLNLYRDLFLFSLLLRHELDHFCEFEAVLRVLLARLV